MIPRKITEKFLPTRTIGTEAEFNSVKFIDVKDRIKAPEEIPSLVKTGLLSRIMEKLRNGI